MFCICSRINNFYVYAFYRNLGSDGSLFDCLLDSMARVQSVDDKAVIVFVDDANAHHSEWLESVSHTYRHGRDALDFCFLSGCVQLVRGPTHIADNSLDLVMADVLHSTLQITALSVVCFVSCSLCRSTMSEVLSF